MKFDTTRFFNSHGRQPKGFGMWVIEISGEEVTCEGTLTEVKRSLKIDFPDVKTAVVCP